jgi:NADH-quinone oxidoreductase subunit L
VGESRVPAGLTPWLLAGIALVVAGGGIAVARSLYLTRAGSLRRRRLEARVPGLLGAARNKFYVDEIYGRGIVLPGKRFATYLTDVFDARYVDGLLTGSGTLVARSAEVLRGLQTGYVRSYAAIFLVGVVVIFSVLLIRVAF